MLQTLNFNGPRQINAQATFFRYESGSAGGADESIRVRAGGSDLGLYWPGDSVELPEAVSIIEIVPTTPSCAGVVRVGLGRVQSARLAGTVQVIDTDRATTIADQAINAKISQVAVAGQFPYLQIWNPANSGVVLTLEKLTINCSQACNFTLARETVQSALSAMQFSDSKKWTLAAPKPSKGAKIIGTSASFGALGNNTQLIMPAGQPIVYQPKRPILIYPGVGMGMWADVQNTAVVVMAEWVETDQ